MGADQLTAREEGPVLGHSRADVLDLLRAADQPVGVREVAQRTGLHQNTARFHLEALVAAGLAARETEGRETPGRPRVGYRAAEPPSAGPRRFRLLAEMLASLIGGTMPEPAVAAEGAGREWGEYLTERPPPFQRLDAPEAVAKLTSALAELDFAPDVDAEDDGRYLVNLRQCPFREVAEQHQQVICALHLGLMRGALGRMRAPVTAERLDPFVEPRRCVAVLTTGLAAGSDGDR
jgi:predicted ArsR family transcriptional regulator